MQDKDLKEGLTSRKTSLVESAVMDAEDKSIQ